MFNHPKFLPYGGFVLRGDIAVSNDQLTKHVQRLKMILNPDALTDAQWSGATRMLRDGAEFAVVLRYCADLAVSNAE